MGKSPGKWIKTVLFGKKSSKYNLSKDATSDKKTSITTNSKATDFVADSTVISSSVPPVIDGSGEHAQLEKISSASLMHDETENGRSTMSLDTANHDELIRLEQAATMAQAAFRGYLARRAFWALKGIIRLQALVRGHLVRRQAVATLSCMRALVEFQALVRGQRVRLSGNGPQILQKRTHGESMERSDLLRRSLKSERLSTNAFAAKLASSNTIMPLTIQYDPVEPNSVRNWLERWSCLHFWEPLPRPKKTLDLKPKGKHSKFQSEETDTGRPKRSVRRVPAANLDKNLLNSSENEKPKRTARKVSNIQAESAQEQSQSELERVKRNLRKISVSTVGTSEKSEVTDEKFPPSFDKVSSSVNPAVSEQCPDQAFEKVNNEDVVVTKQPEPEPLPAPPLEDKSLDIKPPGELSAPIEANEKVDNEPASNVESSGKENQKTRRRKSFPAKQEYPESISHSQNAPTLPSYMAATESAKAKLRAQAAAKAAEDGAENGFVRRHSLPSTGKLSLHSPRVQKPLQANGKGATKANKPQVSSRDEKVLSAGWRR